MKKSLTIPAGIDIVLDAKDHKVPDGWDKGKGNFYPFPIFMSALPCRMRRLRRNKKGLKAKDFLVPVGPLRILFKNKFLAKLGRAYKEGALIFPGMVEALAMPNKFYELKDNLYAKNWVVYCR